MKFLKDNIVKDYYDVIVIGAGLGGLTAGALLAKKGFKVLICEQWYIPGGCCSAIKRDGAYMDVGTALFYGFGEDGYNIHRYVHNVLEEEIDMVQHSGIFKMIWPENSVTFWKDFDRFFKELTDAFPESKEELKNFYDDLWYKYNSFMDLLTGPEGDKIPGGILESKKYIIRNAMKHPFRTMKIASLIKKTALEIMDKYISNPEIPKFYDMLFAMLFCTHSGEAPGMFMPAIFIETHTGGACYPVGSPQQVPNHLENALERYGGEILLRHPVKEILFEGKTAAGVQLDDGTIIKSKYVIPNVNIWHLYGTLIKPNMITPKKMEYVENLEPTVGTFLIFLTVDASVIPEGMHEVELYLTKLGFDIEADSICIFLPSLNEPSIVPEGLHSMTIIYPGGGDLWPSPNDPDYQSEAYYKRKQDKANEVLEIVEQYIPNLRKHIKTMEISTISSMERITNKLRGNIGGVKMSLEQNIFTRPRAKTEFKNLFMCGDSTTQGEGGVTCTISGVTAANLVLKDNKMEQYVKWPKGKDYVNIVEEPKKRAPIPNKDDKLTEELAKRVAVECQWCEKAPSERCTNKCPANVDVPNFIRKMEVGNWKGAARLIRSMNPLGEICGIICPAEKLCESNCYHSDFSDEPVRIAQLQAWVCKQAAESGWDMPSPNKKEESIAIVGAGPAGLTCAYYLAQAGYSVEVYEKKEKPGGLLNAGIPSFRLPKDIIDREINGIRGSGIKFNYNKELGKDFTLGDLLEDHKAVFIAPGLGKGKLLDFPGLKDVSVLDALSYLRKPKEEITRKLLIIGGGSVAADVAITAANQGTKDITLVCLESDEEMPALISEIEEMKKLGINLLNSWGPKEITNSKLICKCCTSVFDDKGGFCPEFDESKLKEIEFDQLIMAVGQDVEESLAYYLQKEFNTTKIKVNSETQLIEGHKNIFAGGDIVRGAGTVVEAVADGRRAAMAIYKDLSKF